jgi:hypothetical protein
MSVVVGYLYAASVTAWAVDCYIAFKNIHSLFMTTEIPLLDRADLADDTFNKFVGVQEMLFVFNVCEIFIFHAFFDEYYPGNRRRCGRHLAHLGRLPRMDPSNCGTLCSTSRGIWLDFCAILTPVLCSLDLFAVFALIDVTFSLYQGSTPLPGAATIYVKSQILVWGFSLGTNILCTLLIGFKAWYASNP